jgi:hypothetical protein
MLPHPAQRSVACRCGRSVNRLIELCSQIYLRHGAEIRQSATPTPTTFSIKNSGSRPPAPLGHLTITAKTRFPRYLLAALGR